MKEKSGRGGRQAGKERRQKSEAGRRWHDTVRPWRTDVETIEARYTSESLFALMAYVWKREGRQGEMRRDGELAFYRGTLMPIMPSRPAPSRRAETPRVHHLLLAALSFSGPRLATPRPTG